MGQRRGLAFHRPMICRASESRQALGLHTLLQRAVLCSSTSVMKGTLSDHSQGEIAKKSVTKASRCSSSSCFIWSSNTDILTEAAFHSSNICLIPPACNQNISPAPSCGVKPVFCRRASEASACCGNMKSTFPFEPWSSRMQWIWEPVMLWGAKSATKQLRGGREDRKLSAPSLNLKAGSHFVTAFCPHVNICGISGGAEAAPGTRLC